MPLIIDTQSGTCFSASSAVYLDDKHYSDEEWEAVADNDADISELGIKKEIPIIKTENLLQLICQAIIEYQQDDQTEEETAVVLEYIIEAIQAFRPDLFKKI